MISARYQGYVNSIINDCSQIPTDVILIINVLSQTYFVLDNGEWLRTGQTHLIFFIPHSHSRHIDFITSGR